jgi:transaldolase
MYADASTLEEIDRFVEEPFISGFTTNPTLIRKGGYSDYQGFAEAAIERVKGLPLSLEVVTDDIDEMVAQGKRISSWGSNLFVKIPIMTTDGHSTLRAVTQLLESGVAVNVTAILTTSQVESVVSLLDNDSEVIVSVFAGRIADTGIDPLPLMKQYASLTQQFSRTQLLWASPREVLNVVQAVEAGCDIITATPAVLDKIKFLGMDLHKLSQETVAMFVNDARAAGFKV